MGLTAPRSSFDKQHVLPFLDVKLCQTGPVPLLLNVWLVPLKESVGGF